MSENGEPQGMASLVFLEALLSQMAPATQRSYHTQLKRFCALGGCEWPSAAGAAFLARAGIEDCAKFVKDCAARGIAPQSQRYAIILMNQVFLRLVEADLRETNPMKTFKALKFRETEVRRAAALSSKDVTRLLNSPRGSNREAVRDRAVLALLFGCGLRRSEVWNLRLGDIRVSTRGVAYVALRTSKAGRPSAQPMAPWVAERVSAYVKLRWQDGALNTHRLVCRYLQDGTPRDASNRFVNDIVRRHAERCGFKNVTSHSGRVSSITHLLASGHGPRKVMQFSRHASIQAMERYDRYVEQMRDNLALQISFADEEK